MMLTTKTNARIDVAKAPRTWSLLAAAMLVLALVLTSKTAAIHAPTLHLDGAFQTASGLFRLHAGQLPGRDFFPYLGIGPLFVLFPVFELFGAHLAASVTAAHLVVLVALAVNFTVAIYLLSGSRGTALDAVVLGLLLAGLVSLGRPWMPWWITDRLTPGNSLRPLRTVAPYLVALALFHASRDRRTARAAVSMGAIFAIAALWSNDYAVPCMLLCAFAGLGLAVAHRSVQLLVLFSVAAAVLGGAALALATGGHPLELLNFNLQVAQDQWWYFGPWSEMYRVMTARDLFKEFQWPGWSGLAIAAALLLLGVAVRSARLWALLAIGVALFLGGALASVGGHLAGYFEAFSFWGPVVLVSAAASLLVRWTADRPRARAGVFVLGAAALAGQAAWAYGHTLAAAKADSSRFYVGELGAYLPVSWSGYVAAARSEPHTEELEEYFGVWSALRRPQPRLRVDSVIHALGRERQRAAAVVDAEPELLVTTVPRLTEWQGWSFSANYWFFRPIAHGHYTPLVRSPYTIVWKRKADPAPVGAGAAVPCQAQGSEISTANAPGLLEVELEYRNDAKGRSLLLVGNGIIDRESLGGRLSLPPRSGRVVYPVRVTAQNAGRFDLQTFPLQASAAATGCVARRLTATELALFDYSAELVKP